MLTRRGASLAEALIALGMAGAVIALSTSLGNRQQQFHRELRDAADRLDQVGQTAALLPIDLRAVSPAEGDIAPGQARDTSIQFRSTIGTAVVCDTLADGVVLAPVTTEPPSLASYLVTPVAGDSAWWLDDSDDAADSSRWTPLPIQSTGSSPGGCEIGGATVWPNRSFHRLTLRFPAGTVRPRLGAPVRVTRPARYSLYQSSDGGWYVGAKEWNPATGRFNTIQPVSGPFLSPAKGGLALRYLDSTGSVVPTGAADTRAIALVEITLRSDSGSVIRSIWFSSATQSAVFSVALRNRGRAR